MGRCSEKLEIRSVRHLGLAARIKARDWVLVGQDGGRSIKLREKTLFVFDDTLIFPFDPDNPVEPPRPPVSREQGIFLANCAALAEPGDQEKALAELRYYTDEKGRPREILPATEEERRKNMRFWPLHGLLIGEKVFLYYLGIRQVGHGPWGFEAIGSGLAVFDPESGASERLHRDGDWRLWNLRGLDVHFGVQVVRLDDEVHVFSSLRRGLRFGVRLAKVKVDDIADPGGYQYLSSPEPKWGSSLAESYDLGSCGSDFSVSYNEHIGCYVMAYVDGYRKELYLKASEEIWGPYSRPTLVGELPHDKDSQLIGTCFEHPIYAQEGGKTTFVTYCQPSFIQNSLVAVTFP